MVIVAAADADAAVLLLLFSNLVSFNMYTIAYKLTLHDIDIVKLLPTKATKATKTAACVFSICIEIMCTLVHVFPYAHV